MTILLESDVVAVLMLMLLFCGPVILAFVTGKKVVSRRSGLVLGSPDTIPNVANFLSDKSKFIYKKIKASVDPNKYKKITATTDKIILLKQLNELKESNIISNDEFEILKKDILNP